MIQRAKTQELQNAAAAAAKESQRLLGDLSTGATPPLPPPSEVPHLPPLQNPQSNTVHSLPSVNSLLAGRPDDLTQPNLPSGGSSYEIPSPLSTFNEPTQAGDDNDSYFE
jgi:hypothetical protein